MTLDELRLAVNAYQGEATPMLVALLNEPRTHVEPEWCEFAKTMATVVEADGRRLERRGLSAPSYHAAARRLKEHEGEAVRIVALRTSDDHFACAIFFASGRPEIIAMVAPGEGGSA